MSPKNNDLCFFVVAFFIFFFSSFLIFNINTIVVILHFRRQITISNKYIYYLFILIIRAEFHSPHNAACLSQTHSNYSSTKSNGSTFIDHDRLFIMNVLHIAWYLQLSIVWIEKKLTFFNDSQVSEHPMAIIAITTFVHVMYKILCCKVISE